MKLNNNDDSHNSGLNLLIYNMLLDIESHPAWVCGLKQAVRKGASGDARTWKAGRVRIELHGHCGPFKGFPFKV